jgi:UDP-N-acetyl-D-glucosamine dehydrogenase
MAPAALSTAALAEALSARIRRRNASICVMGLGYVGLPLAESFTQAGHTVIGFDIDAEKVARLRSGQSYIGHIASERVTALIRGGRFEATDDHPRLADTDAIVICVPTPLTAMRDPDLSCVIDAGKIIGRHLHRGQLVILESTTYPGTTEDVLKPILEQSGLLAGSDFFLAYSPEREDPGNPDFSPRNTPKVVGGVDPTSCELAAALYEPVVKGVVAVSGTRIAEACKILENTYRAVNIALVNELKVVFDAMGIDIWEVIAAARTKPFGFQAFYPGPGLGGHCIPIDPFYLTWIAHKFGQDARFIELAGEINTAMPRYVVERIAKGLNEEGKAVKGSRVLVLGAAYKKDVDDLRESPAVPILELLERDGALISYNDPFIPRLNLPRLSMQLASEPLTEAFLARQDCVVIVTDHSTYDFAWIARHAPLLVDTRNAANGIANASARILKA